MKKKLLIGLGTFYTLILVLITASVIYFWPYISAVDWSLVSVSNVKALYQGLTEAPEVTNEKRKALDSKRSEEIRAYVSMDLRDFTDEEKLQIESGEKSETQILAQIITEAVENKENSDDKENSVNNENTSSGGNTEEKPDENKADKQEGSNNENSDSSMEKNQNANTNANVNSDENSNNSSNTEKEQTNEKTETADQIVARHVSALYNIQNEFESRVSALASSASNWVKAYKKANPGITWKDAKVAGVKYFSGKASGLESECYAKVDAQIELLKSDLKAIGADTSIVNTIKNSAYSEMEAKKAQIIQQGNAKLSKND